MRHRRTTCARYAQQLGAAAAPTIRLRQLLSGRSVTLLKLDIDSKEGALLHVATHMIERNLTEVRSILIGLGDFKAHMTVMGTCNHARNALLMRNGLPQPLPEGADSWVSCRGGGRYSSLPRLRVISSGLPPTGTHRLKSHHLRSATVDTEFKIRRVGTSV